MKKGIFLDLTEIRSFFHLVTYNQNASREEVYNFLQECLKYVFKINNLNIKNYNITIHSVKTMFRDDEVACMYRHETHDNEFHVLLNYNDMSLKNGSIENLEKLLDLIYSAFHEYAHIMQYILFPDVMDSYDNEKAVVYQNMQNLVRSKNTKDANILIREYVKHDNAKRITSAIEKDANSQAYQYFSLLLKTLKQDEDDINLLNLYDSIFTYIKNVRKDEYYNYRIHNKLNKQAIQILSNYNINKEDLITF